jgi:hypothetical protein
MALRNIKLTIAYDGSDYHGWQIQPGCVTVQGVLTEAVRSLLGPRARICGASRTDAGVSALGQVGLIQIDTPIPTENFVKAITDRLPESMAIVKAEEVPMGFDVIGDVRAAYRLICCGPTVGPAACGTAGTFGGIGNETMPWPPLCWSAAGFQVLCGGSGPPGRQRSHGMGRCNQRRTMAPVGMRRPRATAPQRMVRNIVGTWSNRCRRWQPKRSEILEAGTERRGPTLPNGLYA